MPTVAPAPAILERYEPVIGIEVHCQLKTVSKMFCGCSTAYDGAAPNTHVCPVCLGLPGALPVINRRAVELVLATGAALGATTPDATRWDRKNYFYPDLPKGYQISQYDLPLASAGALTFETTDGPFTVQITRAHLEEDTAKLVHAPGPEGDRVSLVDFNRSGAPLMEIVTEPDVRTAEQARRYAEELQLLLRTIGASDADMERGQMRVEANVSLRPRGQEAFGTRVEVKNMNSFRSVERAVAFEIERQAEILDRGETLVMETRGWSDEQGKTYRMRAKETSDDYRYFPEPDLPPLRVEASWLEGIRAGLPELPGARRTRYREVLGLSPYDAAVLAADVDAHEVFERELSSDSTVPPSDIAKLVIGEYLRLRNKYLLTSTESASIDEEAVFLPPGGLQEIVNLSIFRTHPGSLARVARYINESRISRTNAKEVVEAVARSRGSVDEIIEARGLTMVSDVGEIGEIVDSVLAANPSAVADVRAGKDQAIGFLVGQVMKATRGQANAAVAQAAVRERLATEPPGS
jgi:aspartyl-tRNA(Asn)/glutamyl-tRNA(Gln) amidotransferase subunit B